MRDNLEQADIYLNQLVKEERFEIIVFADESGEIVLSTQKKIEEEDFSKHFNIAYLEGEKIQIDYKDDKYFVSAPVMGFSDKLGTLYFEYSKR